MKSILLLTVTLLLALTGPALGQGRLDRGKDGILGESGYLRLGFGTTRVSLSGSGPTEGGFAMEAAAGVGFSKRVHWDVVGISYGKWDGTDVGGPYNGSRFDLGSNVWLGNFDQSHNFRPYLGGGIGTAHITEDAPGGASGFDDWGFAWSVGAGFEYQITSALAIGPRYFFRQAFVDDGNLDVNTHEFTLSIIWNN